MTIELPGVDLGKLENEAKEILKAQLDKVLEGAKEDVEEFVKEISKDMIRAIMEGRDDLKQALKDQLKVLAEINRIRITNAGIETVKFLVQLVGETIVAGAKVAV